MGRILAVLAQFRDRLVEFWTGLSPRQRVVLVASTVLIFAAIWSFRSYMAQKAYRPLYTDLSAEEAGTTVTRLKELEIPYKLVARGSTIMVPEQHLDDARLQLAIEQLPRSGRQGFELFDQSSFGATEFAEQVNFRRALEGELERTIRSLDEVDRARVHISLPKRSVFLDYEQVAKASVVLQLKRSEELPKEKVDAITHLIASAVEGLDSGKVVVVDTRGRILAKPRPEGQEFSGEQLDYRRRIESQVEKKILATLEPYIGFDRSRANVRADVDWNGGEQTEEIYDPNTVVMSTQRSEETSQPTQQSGVPGTASNLPRQPATPRVGATGHSRTLETTNYKTSRTVTNMKIEPGEVKRLSVAVLVDQVIEWDEAARKLVRRPRQEEEMATLRELVLAAAGIDEQRGDTLTIENLPFTIFEPPVEPPPEPQEEPSVVWLNWIKDNRYNLVAGAVVTLVLAVAFLWWNRRRSKRKALRAKKEAEQRAEQSLRELEAAEEAESLKEAEEAKLLQGLRNTTLSTSRAQVLKKHLEETAANDPDAFVQLLRSWIHEDDE